MQNYQYTQLRGFHVATAEMPHMESVSVGIFIPVGSRHEPIEVHGIAHFLEHMIFKGTAKRNALELAKEIEGIGGTINAYTTEDQTCLEARGPAECLQSFLEIMSDMLWHSQFNPEEIDREREVIAEEIIMYQENPGDHINDLLATSTWPDHPLGRPITGSIESITHIDRPKLTDFFQKHYRSEGITLAVAGKINHEDVLRLADIHLPQESLPRQGYPVFEKKSPTDEIPLIHDQREIEQTHLAIAFHTPGHHAPERHALRVLSLLLGETMSSRLFQELRENRGLCYQVETDFSLYDDTGTFEICVGLDSERLLECLTAIHSLISELLKHGFSEKEIEHVRNYASGQARISLETPHAHMSWLGETLTTYSKIIDPEKARQQLELVTQDQVITVARAIFHRDNVAIASIGPQSPDEMLTLCQQLFPFQ